MTSATAFISLRSLPLGFEHPAWLWLLLLVPVVIVASLRLLNALEPTRRILAITVRCLVLAVLALCLAGLVYVRTSDKLSVIFLMDRSDSVKGLQQTQEEYLQAVTRENRRPDDRVGMIDFARHAFVQQLPIAGGYLLEPGRLPDMENRDRTDVAAAIRLALAAFPADSTKRIVLMSDGNDNMGDVLTEAATAQAEGAVIDVVPLWYRHAAEVYFDRMVAPTNVQDGDMVPVRMLLHAERRTTGRIDIYRNGQLIELPPDYTRITLEPGNNPFTVKIPVHGGGPQRFEARFVPDDPERDDSIPENNYATAFSFVAGKSRTLILSNRPEDDQPLADALQREKIDVELRDVSLGRVDLLDLLSYTTVILANVPADTFTDEQQKALVHYVSELGGGLIMTGGDQAFGAGGWIGSPVADILPVHCEIKHKRVIPRGALVLVMHSCEIARGNYWGTEVAKKSVDTISSKDYIGVLAYTWSPGGVNWEVPLQLATNKTAVKRRIERMQIGDMPDFDSTLRMAHSGLVATDAAQKHIILISDGDPSPPAPSLVQALKDAHITCSTVGIGFGVHVVERTLSDLAAATGGRYYACRDPRTLPQIFVKESRIVRRPLISEKLFTPQVEYAFSDLLAGIEPHEALPPLTGLVLTSPKAEAQIALIRASEEEKDPVLAHWQAGLGKAVAFTSGYWPRWGNQWVAWPKFSKLWAQIVRWSMRQEAPANLDVFTRIEGNKGRVVVDALDKDAGSLNLLSLPGAIIKPDQTVEPLVFTQTGAGHYEAEFDVDQTGQFIANVAVNEQGQYKGSLQTGLSVPFSPEFRELATNIALLQRVREITGGRELALDPLTDDVFLHNLPPIVSKVPVWDWSLAWLLLPLFLLDVAARRLANWLAFSLFAEIVLIVFLLFGVGWAYRSPWSVAAAFAIGELVGWSIRFRSIAPAIDFITHSVTALAHAGQRSTASLGRLKDVRERVRDAQPEPTDASAPAPADRPAPPSVDRARRFDVGDQAARAKPTEDLTTTLGGAAAADTRTDKPPTPAPADSSAEPAEDPTTRLLKAKRRAQRDLQKPPE